MTQFDGVCPLAVVRDQRVYLGSFSLGLSPRIVRRVSLCNRFSPDKSAES